MRRQSKEKAVYSLLRFLIMVLVSMAVWMALGLGVGFLLHQLVPTIDLGGIHLARDTLFPQLLAARA
jgi:hypothetical protein